MRRSVDIVVSLAAICLLSPLLLLIAAAVAIDTRGGPFFFAQRIGKGGQPFRMWKFRTMVTGSALKGAITGRKDPRITRVGAILRRTKLDELPQFFNVLMGDMTLVGPRPEAPEIVARYSRDQIPILVAKPGITGCVQLDSCSESESIPPGAHAEEYYVRHLMPLKVQRDLEYIRTKAAWSDTRLLFRTLWYVVRAIANPFETRSSR